MSQRTIAATVLKVMTLFCAALGMTLAFVFATRDGYAHPLYRLLYFTNLSNIWIAASAASVLFIPLIPEKKRERWSQVLYSLKFVFTVSIAITGIVFCTVLAPFARGYNPWTLSNVLTHVAVPLLAIADLFVDTHSVNMRGFRLLYSAIPPALYLAASSVLSILRVDFGRGDPFPYFFLNYYSPAGVFGFSSTPPYILGSFYWIIIFLGMVLSVAFVLERIKRGRVEKSASDS